MFIVSESATMPYMNRKEIKTRLQHVLDASPEKMYVKRISLFGSHLHGTAKKNSDIDLLLELEEPISMFKLVRLERELSSHLGTKVDLCTPMSLSKYFRDDVLQEAEPIFQTAV
jgi:uncharacterized protein